MTSAITVGPATLDGADYGQDRCQDMTVEQRARMEADAALIAAAPDLLAALKWTLRNFLDDLDEDGELYKAAHAAITKAEGRS
jgi:hypothetical protein